MPFRPHSSSLRHHFRTSLPALTVNQHTISHHFDDKREPGCRTAGPANQDWRAERLPAVKPGPRRKKTLPTRRKRRARFNLCFHQTGDSSLLNYPKAPQSGCVKLCQRYSNLSKIGHCQSPVEPRIASGCGCSTGVRASVPGLGLARRDLSVRHDGGSRPDSPRRRSGDGDGVLRHHKVFEADFPLSIIQHRLEQGTHDAVELIGVHRIEVVFAFAAAVDQI